MSVGGRCVDRGDMAAVLATARREILQLAIAIAVVDEDGAAVASARLRWALCVAEQLAASRSFTPPDEAAQLESVRAHANRWLSTAPREFTVSALLRMAARDTARRARGEPFIDATNASVEGLFLDGLVLSLCLRKAALAEVTARHALMNDTDATAAHFRACRLYGCSMERATFDDARFDECDLSGAGLDGSSWRRSTALYSTLMGTSLRDANLEEVTFVDCDLRWATLDITNLASRSGLRGARFVRCDLRETSWLARDLGGVSFIDCKLYGVRGAPMMSDVAIENPDLSARADGSQCGTRGDVIATWSAAATLGRPRISPR